MRRFSSLAVVLLLAAACNAELVGASAPGGVRGTGTSDGGFFLGGSDGGTGGLVNDGDGGVQQAGCPAGQHMQSNQCVPDEITCAEEFPCPMGLTCTAGRCIQIPGSCATNDDCPVGDVCTSGQCVALCAQNAQCTKDADCGQNGLCVQCMCTTIQACSTPSADLTTPAVWMAHQDLHLDQALGSFGKSVAGILKSLRDAILGCPNGGSTCFLLQLVVPFIPDWAQQLIVGLGNFADFLDNHDFLIDSHMEFTPNGKPGGYNGVDHWDMLSFSYMGQQVQAAPQNVPQIGKPVDIPFTASAVCGVLYVDKHKVEGVLSGILKWIIDTVVELESNGMYNDLGQAIAGSVDCSQLAGNLPAMIACQAAVSGIASKIDSAINSWLLDYSLMTLKGTAVITDGQHLDDGHWDGTLGNGGTIFNDFNGEWSASR